MVAGELSVNASVNYARSLGKIVNVLLDVEVNVKKPTAKLQWAFSLFQDDPKK